MTKHLLGIACILAAAACDNGIPIDELPGEIVDAQCDYLARCGEIVDRATCLSSVNLDGDSELQAILDGVEDGTIKYDEGKAGACADSLRGQSCDFRGFHNSGSPCDDVFVGTVPPGGACVVDVQCANDGNCEQTDPSCDSDTTCCPSTCVASTQVISQAGGPCGSGNNVCADNLYCRRTSQTMGTCEAPLAQEGAPCEELAACANPMYCNLTVFGGDGTCTRPAASGAACSEDKLVPCLDNRDYCSPTSRTCVRAAAPGATCGNGIECVGYATCIDNTCVADVLPGGACTVDDNAPDCAGGTECIGGTCQLPPPGMVCTL